MDRFKDYVGFAIWFAGLGYIVLWPLTAPNAAGQLFGASVVCQAHVLFDWLCNSTHPLTLPPVLHVIGMLSAVSVTVRVLLIGLRRSRRTGIAPAPVAPLQQPQPLRRKFRRPPLPIKPRSQFGLRGTQR
jgi:hypothetical protein